MDPVEKKAAETPLAPEATKEPAATEAPKYVTEEQLTKILGARFKGFGEKLEKSVGDALEAFGGKLKTDFAALLPQPKPEAAPPDGKKKDAATPATAESPELKKLQDQLAELTTKAEKASAERDAERAKSRETTLRQKVTETLVGAGVDAARARHAMGLLVDTEKRVRWSDAGDALVFRNADDDDIELTPGVKSWLKSDDGKFYLPPRGAAGSGDRGGGSPPRAPEGTPDRATVAEGLRRALTGGF